VSNVARPLVQASLLGEAIDRGPVLVLVADEDGNYVAVNEYACELLGYTREELLAQRAPDRDNPGILRSKDGTLFELEHWTQPTQIAGMLLTVVVCWPPASSQPAAPSRLSAPAHA
jgi:PAS domain-containing protein